MLSQETVDSINRLVYRDDAVARTNILPFGSVFWEDEMPPLADLFSFTDDMLLVHAIFGLRIRLWDGETLDEPDQTLWNAIRRQVPAWPVFGRLKLNEKQVEQRRLAEEEVEREFESLL